VLLPSPDRDTDRGGTDTQTDVMRVLQWYAGHARDLPWRAADRSAWAVLVSEVMLQQTQVSRVEPVWRAWMDRWPTPAALAAAPIADVLRAWQGMGYPRRALRLHATAAAIVEHHDGEVPDDEEQLRALPGIGDYTAAAVLAFAHGRSAVVLDTNVRRVLARWLTGAALPRNAAPSRAERSVAADLLPGDGLDPTWSVAVMELGALICTARSPSCAACPLQVSCTWWHAGCPPAEPRVRTQRFEGSDRQARGYLLRAVTAGGAVDAAELVDRWVEQRGNAPAAVEQGERALASLLADGLLRRAGGDLITLP
jgi:A/G-specific adenine glycosylase